MNINVYCENCKEGLAYKDNKGHVTVKDSIPWNYSSDLEEVMCICIDCGFPRFIEDVVFAKTHVEETSLWEDCMNDRYGITNDGDLIAHW